MEKEKELLKLAETKPFPYFIISDLFLKCRLVYAPKEKALEKLIEILDTASAFAISTDDAFELQFIIDFELQ